MSVQEMEAIVGTNFLPEPLRTTVNGNLSRLRMTSWLRCAAHEYRRPRRATPTFFSTTRSRTLAICNQNSRAPYRAGE